MQDSVWISSIECVFALMQLHVHGRLQIHDTFFLHSNSFLHSALILQPKCCITYAHSLVRCCVCERKRTLNRSCIVACTTETYAYRCMCQSNCSSHSHIQTGERISKQASKYECIALELYYVSTELNWLQCYCRCRCRCCHGANVFFFLSVSLSTLALPLSAPLPFSLALCRFISLILLHFNISCFVPLHFKLQLLLNFYTMNTLSSVCIRVAENKIEFIWFANAPTKNNVGSLAYSMSTKISWKCVSTIVRSLALAEHIMVESIFKIFRYNQDKAFDSFNIIGNALAAHLHSFLAAQRAMYTYNSTIYS